MKSKSNSKGKIILGISVIVLVVVAIGFYSSTTTTTISTNGANIEVGLDYIVTYSDNSQDIVPKPVTPLQSASIISTYNDKQINTISIRPNFKSDIPTNISLKSVTRIDDTPSVIKSTYLEVGRTLLYYDTAVISADSFTSSGQHKVTADFLINGQDYSGEELIVTTAISSEPRIDNDGAVTPTITPTPTATPLYCAIPLVNLLCPTPTPTSTPLPYGYTPIPTPTPINAPNPNITYQIIDVSISGGFT